MLGIRVDGELIVLVAFGVAESLPEADRANAVADVVREPVELVPADRDVVVARVLVEVLADEAGVVALLLQPGTERVLLPVLPHLEVSVVLHAGRVRVLAGEDRRAGWAAVRRRREPVPEDDGERRAHGGNDLHGVGPLVVDDDEEEIRLVLVGGPGAGVRKPAQLIASAMTVTVAASGRGSLIKGMC